MAWLSRPQLLLLAAVKAGEGKSGTADTHLAEARSQSAGGVSGFCLPGFTDVKDMNQSVNLIAKSSSF